MALTFIWLMLSVVLPSLVVRADSVAIAGGNDKIASEVPGGINALEFLGSANGKSFFLDTVHRNWTAARDSCNSSGLELAAIETVDQLNVLMEAARTKPLNNYYWTAARDAHAPRQFSWDTTNTQPSSFLTWYPSSPTTFETCATILLYNSNTNNGKMYIVKCSRNAYPLCQTPL